MIDIEHPNDLITKVHGSIAIDLYNQDLHHLLKDHLVDTDTPNIYFKGSTNPIISKKISLYIANKQNLVPIEDYDLLLEHPTNVYNKDAEIVLRAEILEQHKKHLTSTPSIPNSLTVMIESYLVTILNRMCVKSMTGISYDISNYVTDIDEDTVLDMIEEHYSNEISMLYEFIGTDTWNLYFKHRKNSLLVIEKSVDWRIYEWHRANYIEPPCES